MLWKCRVFETSENFVWSHISIIFHTCEMHNTKLVKMAFVFDLVQQHNKTIMKDVMVFTLKWNWSSTLKCLSNNIPLWAAIVSQIHKYLCTYFCSDWKTVKLLCVTRTVWIHIQTKIYFTYTFPSSLNKLSFVVFHFPWLQTLFHIIDIVHSSDLSLVHREWNLILSITTVNFKGWKHFII